LVSEALLWGVHSGLSFPDPSLVTSELSRYFRSPELETLYTSEFTPLLRKEYGGAEAFLLHRLQWTKAEVEEARETGLYFTRDIEPKYTRIRLNDWQYSIPKEFE
jgi:hypothetical protein